MKRFILTFALMASTAVPAVFGAFAEAPELRRQVEAGTLPALEQRLPLAPVVISPVEKPGEYGGTWRITLVGYDSNSMLSRTLAYEHLVRWDSNWTRVVPNIASSWTVNADATVYRFQLRRGMRWSDGQPFTARDIVAWVDDIARDPQMTSVPPAWIAVGGRLPECSAPDDYTLEFRFAAPYALFLENLAGVYSKDLTHYPAHYFRKIHPRYNPKGAAELMQQTGLPWAAAFRTVYTPWNWHLAGIPTIDPWVIANAYVPGVEAVVAERNPYYWKVDTLGRQLPYLDRVKFEVVADNETALRRALEGKIDYQRQDFASVNTTAGAAIVAAEKSGRIRTVRVIPSRSNSISLSLNLVHPDPAMRAVLGDRRVRIALSEAINRPGIIQQLYAGEGKPWQLAPRPVSPFFNRRLGEQYTGYEPEHSKQRLEEAGLPARASDGMRTLPDGRLFQINVMVASPLSSPNWLELLDQIKKDWRAIGVSMEWSLLPQSEFFSRLTQNQHDAAVMKGAGGYAAMLEPEFFVPASFENAAQVFYAIPWARWFNDPNTPGAETPPKSVVSQMEVFRRVMIETDPTARSALMAQVLEMAADEFYLMGICLEPDRVAIRSPGFRNVPASHFDSWLYPDPGPFNPCQFFLENSTP